MRTGHPLLCHPCSYNPYKYYEFEYYRNYFISMREYHEWYYSSDMLYMRVLYDDRLKLNIYCCQFCDNNSKKSKLCEKCSKNIKNLENNIHSKMTDCNIKSCHSFRFLCKNHLHDFNMRRRRILDYLVVVAQYIINGKFDIYTSRVIFSYIYPNISKNIFKIFETSEIKKLCL